MHRLPAGLEILTARQRCLQMTATWPQRLGALTQYASLLQIYRWKCLCSKKSRVLETMGLRDETLMSLQPAQTAKGMVRQPRKQCMRIMVCQEPLWMQYLCSTRKGRLPDSLQQPPQQSPFRRSQPCRRPPEGWLHVVTHLHCMRCLMAT